MTRELLDFFCLRFPRCVIRTWIPAIYSDYFHEIKLINQHDLDHRVSRQINSLIQLMHFYAHRFKNADGIYLSVAVLVNDLVYIAQVY